MTDFTISLAGVAIGVTAQFPTTERFCAVYRTDDAPAFCVTVTPSDIDAERIRADRQDALDGIPPRPHSDAYLETLALYRNIARELLRYDTVVFHSSVVAVDGRAYAFTAPSGTGKTTHTRLWLENIPGAHVLNGDKPLLRVDGGGVLACGTPWQGKENWGRREILPLAAICLLERGDENRIEAIDLHEALGVLLQQTHRPEEPELVPPALAISGRIGRRVKLYRLACTMDPEAAWVSFRGMT